jgi:hypothetical protein
MEAAAAVQTTWMPTDYLVRDVEFFLDAQLDDTPYEEEVLDEGGTRQLLTVIRSRPDRTTSDLASFTAEFDEYQEGALENMRPAFVRWLRNSLPNIIDAVIDEHAALGVPEAALRRRAFDEDGEARFVVELLTSKRFVDTSRTNSHPASTPDRLVDVAAVCDHTDGVIPINSRWTYDFDGDATMLRHVTHEVSHMIGEGVSRVSDSRRLLRPGFGYAPGLSVEGLDADITAQIDERVTDEIRVAAIRNRGLDRGLRGYSGGYMESEKHHRVTDRFANDPDFLPVAAQARAIDYDPDNPRPFFEANGRYRELVRRRL